MPARPIPIPLRWRWTVVVLALVLAAAQLAGPARTASAAEGPEVTGGRYGFVAAISERAAGDRLVCGGALVAAEWVLTATHCFDGIADVTGLEVSVGQAVRSPDGRRQVERVERLGDDDASTRRWDAALVKLTAPVTDVAPVRVASFGDQRLIEAGQAVTVLGWDGDRLQEAETATAPPGNCDAAFDGLVAGSVVCALPPSPGGSSDGGPMIGTDHDGRAVLLGIGSNATAALGAYTSVRYERVWTWITRTADVARGDLMIPIGPEAGLTMGLLIVNREPVPVTVRAYWVRNDQGRSVKTPVRQLDKGAETGDLVLTLNPGATSEPVIRTPGEAGFPGGDYGAVWVTTDELGARLDGVVNHRDTGQEQLASSPAATGGSRRVALPLLAVDNDGRGNQEGGPEPDNLDDGPSSFTVLQSTDPGNDVTATLTYIWRDDAGTVQSLVRGAYILPPLTSVRVDQRDTNWPGKPPEVFSGLVTAPAGPVTVAVRHQGQGEQGLQSFDGFRPEDTGTTLAAPLVMAANGAFTGLQVQNTSTTESTTVSIRFSNNIAPADSNHDRLPERCGNFPEHWAPAPILDVVIPPGAARTFIQAPARSDDDDEKKGYDPDGRWIKGVKDCRYVGSATITSTQPAAGTVSQAGFKAVSAYEMLNPLVQGPAVAVPLVNVNNPETITGINVQNLTPEREVKVVAAFTPNVGALSPEDVAAGVKLCGRPVDGALVPDPIQFDLGAAAAETLLLGPSRTEAPLSARDSFLVDDGRKCRYVGSATIRAVLDDGKTLDQGGRLGVIVNQFSPWWNKDGLATVALRAR